MKTIQERLRERSGQYDEEDWHSAIELEAADKIDELEARIRELEPEEAPTPTPEMIDLITKESIRIFHEKMTFFRGLQADIPAQLPGADK